MIGTRIPLRKLVTQHAQRTLKASVQLGMALGALVFGGQHIVWEYGGDRELMNQLMDLTEHPILAGIAFVFAWCYTLSHRDDQLRTGRRHWSLALPALAGGYLALNFLYLAVVDSFRFVLWLTP
jgi:hypothetical protein